MEERDEKMLEFMTIAILADYDLMGLISRGASHDEYSPEARTILRYLKDADYEVKTDVLAYRIQYIFAVWFNEEIDIVPCIMIANELKKMI
jgi:hypothetical protein